MTSRAKAAPKSSRKSGRGNPRRARPTAKRRAPTPASAARILDLIGSMWAARALGAFARLGIADMLTGGPRSAQQLAPALGVNEGSLFRLLRAVVSIGALTKHPANRFALSAFGQCLRSGVHRFGGRYRPLGVLGPAR